MLSSQNICFSELSDITLLVFFPQPLPAAPLSHFRLCLLSLTWGRRPPWFSLTLFSPAGSWHRPFVMERLGPGLHCHFVLPLLLPSFLPVFLPSCLPPIFLPLFHSVSSCSFPPILLSSVPHECAGSAAFLSQSRPPTTPDFDLILSPAHVSSFSGRCPC